MELLWRHELRDYSNDFMPKNVIKLHNFEYPTKNSSYNLACIKTSEICLEKEIKDCYDNVWCAHAIQLPNQMINIHSFTLQYFQNPAGKKHWDNLFSLVEIESRSSWLKIFFNDKELRAQAALVTIFSAFGYTESHKKEPSTYTPAHSRRWDRRRFTRSLYSEALHLRASVRYWCRAGRLIQVYCATIGAQM